jgi:CBS domain-containing protein
VGDHSIYWAQIPNRAASPAHRLAIWFPLLAAMTARSATRSTEGEDARPLPSLRVDVRTPLDEALMNMAETDVDRAVIVDGRTVVGTQSYRDALAAYRRMLQAGLDQAERLPLTSMLLDFTVGEASPVANFPLRDIDLPADTLVVAIRQQGEPVFPLANFILHPTDVVTVLARVEAAADLRVLLT